MSDFIKANGLLDSADKVLLAVSGGADSTALLFAMQALSAADVFDAELFCAHINHQLRGANADSDEDFVITQAKELNLPVITKRIDVRGYADCNKLSIETAARKLRIESLLEIARANNCRCIATAHHKNDNAETILQRLTRGTGYRGLGGIWPIRIFKNEFKFIRPLLCVSRDEIIEYLKKRNLKWCHDHTNTDCTYRRNFIRHRLLPALQKDCKGSLIEQLSGLSEYARRFHQQLCQQSDELWPEVADCDEQQIILDLNILSAQPPPVIIELVRKSLALLGSGEKDITQLHYENILHLIKQNISGKKLELPHGFIVQREYNKLIFKRDKEETNIDTSIGESAELKIPGKTTFGEYLIEAKIIEADSSDFEKFKNEKTEFVEWFDLDKIKPPLFVRFRQTGDRFVPFGLDKEKKVGKFLTAARVPGHIRQKILIVCDSEKIIWVWPVRISEQIRVAGETRKILQLQITNSALTS
ncbi:MAG: tRNA lysidine(34) synthetase TilS [Phycisphaerales bacterium]